MKTNALSIQPDHAGPQSDRRGGRRPVRALVGVAAGVLLAVAVPAAASAHVHVDPGEAPAGATERLTFSFSHGCEGSPTTALVFDIPDEVGNATPIVSGGWTITRELGTDGLPTQITYTAGAPLDGGIKAELSMDVRFEESAEGTEVAFPVTQECVTGAHEWTQVAADGEDPAALESPAPLVAVGAFVEDTAGHAGDHAADDHAAEAADDHAAGADAAVAGDASAQAEAPAAADDPVARIIAGAAGVIGIAALVTAIVTRRTRRN